MLDWAKFDFFFQNQQDGAMKKIASGCCLAAILTISNQHQMKGTRFAF